MSCRVACCDMSVLFAYDYSGSTCGCASYHATTQNILKEYEGMGKALRIVRWSEAWREISREELRRINRCAEGTGCTLVQAVAEAIRKMAFRGKLVLLTDGEVDADSIDRCDALMAGYDGLTCVDVHIIKGRGEANLSVSCPFTRTCPHTIRTYESHQMRPEDAEVTVVAQADMDLLATLDGVHTVADFEAVLDGLLRALTARMMGRADADTRLHDQLVRLQGRLRAEASRDKTRAAAETLVGMAAAIAAGDADGALQRYRDVLRHHYDADTGGTWATLATMLNITQGGLRAVFSHRLRRVETLEAGDAEVQAVPDADGDAPADEPPFTCPILLEEDAHNVAILVRDRPPLFEGLSPAAVEELLNCPLSALNRPALVQAIADCLDAALSVQAIQMAERHADGSFLQRSPLTRERTVGALYLGANASQAAATDAALARMLTGPVRKRAGNMDLWAAVVWLVMKDLPRFAEALPAVERHMRWRLAHRTSHASLSGNPQYLNVRVPLGLAAWMVVVSPLLELPAKHDAMRAHAFHAAALRRLVDLSGWQLPPGADGALEAHAARLTALYRFLRWVKRAPTGFRAAVRALHQRCVAVSSDGAAVGGDSPVRWVPIDGAAPAEQTQAVLAECFGGYGLSAEEVVGLAGLVQPSLAADAIELPVRWTPPPLPPAAVSWPGYGLDTRAVEAPVAICPATARPYYAVADDTWRAALAASYHMPADACISANECYIRFVTRHGRYPASTDEFIVFMHDYYVVRRARASLPAPIAQFAQEVIDMNAALVAALTPAAFAARAEAAMPIQQRLQMETRMA